MDDAILQYKISFFTVIPMTDTFESLNKVWKLNKTISHSWYISIKSKLSLGVSVSKLDPSVFISNMKAIEKVSFVQTLMIFCSEDSSYSSKILMKLQNTLLKRL